MEKRTVSPFPLRLEPDIRKVLEDCARQNERSLQAEIIIRLLESMGLQTDDDKKEEERIRRIATEQIEQVLKEEREKKLKRKMAVRMKRQEAYKRFQEKRRGLPIESD